MRKGRYAKLAAAGQMDLFDWLEWKSGHERADPAPVHDPDDPGPITDDHLAGCVALMAGIIVRAIHDACCVFIARPNSMKDQIKVATDAWWWLHADQDTPNGQDRCEIVEAAGFDPDLFDERVAIAAIPYPDTSSLKNPTLTLEKVYWRLAGCPGPEPTRGLYQNGRQKRPTTRAGRQARRSFILSLRDGSPKGVATRAMGVPA